MKRNLKENADDFGVMLTQMALNPDNGGGFASEKKWVYRGWQCEVVWRSMRYLHGTQGYYCGYAKALDPNAPHLDGEQQDELRVHGGITYDYPKEKGYGFDCAHYDDLHPDSDTQDLAWVKEEVENMVDDILLLLHKHHGYDEPDVVDGSLTHLLPTQGTDDSIMPVTGE